MNKSLDEFIVFINRFGECSIIEGDFEWDNVEFEVKDSTTLDESLLEVDGFGVTCRVDVSKAFKPLKFYKVKWWAKDENTEDGYFETCILESLEEIDYINEAAPKMLDLQKMKFMR